MGRVANMCGIGALLPLAACGEVEPGSAPERVPSQEELDAREVRLLAERKPFPASAAELREWLVGDLEIRIDYGQVSGGEKWSAALTHRQFRHEHGRSHALARHWFASFARRDAERLTRLYARAFEGVDDEGRRLLLAFLLPERENSIKSTYEPGMAGQLSAAGATFQALESGLTQEEFLLLERRKLLTPDAAPPDEFVESALAALEERRDGAELLELWSRLRRR